MLVDLFWTLLVAGCSSAVVLWVFAAKDGYDLLAAAPASGERPGRSAWAMVFAWPFGLRQRAGIGADKAMRLNKMMVAFFAAVLIAAGSAAVYSNLTFVPPAQTDQ